MSFKTDLNNDVSTWLLTYSSFTFMKPWGTRLNGPLTRYVKLQVVHARECRGRFPRHGFQRKPLVSDPGMHHGTCVTHVPWCMSEPLTPRRRVKRSRHTRRMRNPQFYVSGKRPVETSAQGSHKCENRIGCEDDLAPTGNKPLFESMLAQIYVIIYVLPLWIEASVWYSV